MKDTRFFGLSNAAVQASANQSMALGNDEWISKLDKRPSDRSQEEIGHIFANLQNAYHLQRLHPTLLRHLSQYGLYEAVEKNITLFREGEDTRNWYAVVEGRLRVIKNGQNYVVGKGAVFEEITSYDNKRKLTVVTKELCQLIRLERKHMKIFCKSHPYQLKDVVTTAVLELDQIERLSDVDGDPDALVPPRITVDQSNLDGEGQTENADGAIDQLTDHDLVKPKSPPVSDYQASLLLSSIIECFPDYIRAQLGRKHCITAENLMDYIEEVTQSTSKQETIGICQVLLEDAVIKPLDRKQEILDFQTSPSFVYFFPHVSPLTAIDEDDLQLLLDDLIRHSNDALLRMTLRKPPNQRSNDDLEFIFAELQHIKAVAHLSHMIKRELAKVVLLESHTTAGTVLFKQGDEGTCWFIILKGSVNVTIYGKGVVTSLQEGDDFGKLALVNDAPRAASIILREPCHFLRVDKVDFNRILRDVEANTVRLKEHGVDVLVLERIDNGTAESKLKKGSKSLQPRYSVMAGTAEKVLEYMLDTRIEDFMNETEENNDGLLEDFILTYELFTTTEELCENLLRFYKASSKQRQDAMDEAGKSRMECNRKHVVEFVRAWFAIDGDVLFQKSTRDFLMVLVQAVDRDAHTYKMELQQQALMDIRYAEEEYFHRVEASKINVPSDQPVMEEVIPPMRPTDESAIKIYHTEFIQDDETKVPGQKSYTNATSSYSMYRVAAETPAGAIVKLAAKKFCLDGNVVLAEIKSNGEYAVFKEDEVCVETKLSCNGRLFCCRRDDLGHLNPIPQEQNGPNDPSGKILEVVSSRELAYYSTMFDLALFQNVHESELLYHVLGRNRGCTGNYDRLAMRFNQLNWWVATEICLTSSQSKRVVLLKKFIKMAAHCKEWHNFFGFAGIQMGLANPAVTRLTSTWEKLPQKMVKQWKEFEAIMDPSRNHRATRSLLMAMNPPIVPHIILLSKDLTFTHDGNKTFTDAKIPNDNRPYNNDKDNNGMINFEKMHMIAATLKIIRFSQSTKKPVPVPVLDKSHEFNVVAYVRNVKVIDNQRRLNMLSHKREQKKYSEKEKVTSAAKAE